MVKSNNRFHPGSKEAIDQLVVVVYARLIAAREGSVREDTRPRQRKPILVNSDHLQQGNILIGLEIVWMQLS